MKKFFTRICALAAVAACLFGGLYAYGLFGPADSPVVAFLQQNAPSAAAESAGEENRAESAAQGQAAAPAVVATNENAGNSQQEASSAAVESAREENRTESAAQAEPVAAAKSEDNRYFSFDEEPNQWNLFKNAPTVEGFRDLKFGMTLQEAKATDVVKHGVPLFGKIRQVTGGLTEGKKVDSVNVNLGSYKWSDFEWQLLDDVLHAISNKYQFDNVFALSTYDGGQADLDSNFFQSDLGKQDLYSAIDDFYRSHSVTNGKSIDPESLFNAAFRSDFFGSDFYGSPTSEEDMVAGMHLFVDAMFRTELMKERFGGINYPDGANYTDYQKILMWTFENAQVGVFLQLDTARAALKSRVGQALVDADFFPVLGGKTFYEYIREDCPEDHKRYCPRVNELLSVIARSTAWQTEPGIYLSVEYNHPFLAEQFQAGMDAYAEHQTKVAQQKAREAQQKLEAERQEQARKEREAADLQRGTTSDDF